MARSTGKNTIKTGVRIVPRPNPEKKVNVATRNAATQIIRISITFQVLSVYFSLGFTFGFVRLLTLVGLPPGFVIPFFAGELLTDLVFAILYVFIYEYNKCYNACQ